MREPAIKRFAGEDIALALALAFDPLIEASRRGASDPSTRLLKITVTLTIMIAAAISIASLWAHPLILAFALTALAGLKHKIFPIKHELFWFVFVGILGAFAESLLILAGAWSYASVQVINIPVWLPAIWGLTGTSLIILYSGVSGTASA